jgi:hypothetical protein
MNKLNLGVTKSVKEYLFTAITLYSFVKNGYTEFMVIDKKGNHYNMTNSLWYWKWNSIEDWNILEEQDDKKIKVENKLLKEKILKLESEIRNRKDVVYINGPEPQTVFNDKIKGFLIML